MLTTRVQNNQFINHLNNPKKIASDISKLITNYISLNDPDGIDIDYAYRLLFINIRYPHKELSEITDNKEYNRRDIISKKLKINNYIYILIPKYHITYPNLSSLKIPRIKEEFANKITNNDSTIKTCLEGDYNSTSRVIHFLYELYQSYNCNYPEQYLN